MTPPSLKQVISPQETILIRLSFGKFRNSRCEIPHGYFLFLFHTKLGACSLLKIDQTDKEDRMKIRISGIIAHLEGNWTLSGLRQGNIDTLAGTLQKVEAGGARRLQVDCRHVTAIDTIGLQLLYVWMQFARLRGLEPELVNCPIISG